MSACTMSARATSGARAAALRRPAHTSRRLRAAQPARAVAGADAAVEVGDEGAVATGRHYEVCYLLSPDQSQEQLQQHIVDLKEMIEGKGGAIHRLEDWGRRPLAYAIKGKMDANYVLMNFEADADALAEFNTMLNKNEDVIRFMVFSRKEAISEPSPMLGGL